MNRVIVSSELEGIVDKENILGTESPALEKNVCISQSGSELYCSLKKVESTREKTIISARVEEEDIQDALLFLNGKDKTISIGGTINIKASEESISSISLLRKKDMYIWKIIIDNSDN